MHRPRILRRALALSLGGIAGLTAFFSAHRQPEHAAPAAVVSVSTDEEERGVRSTAPALVRAGMPSDSRADDPVGAEEGNRVSTPLMRDVFPDLGAAPQDWRTFNPEQVTVAVLPGLPVAFHVRSFEPGSQRSTWVGDADLPGATLAAIGTAESWTANVSFLEGNNYVITVADGRVLVDEINPDLEACGNGPAAATVEPLGTTAAGGPVARADEATTYTSDVLFLYDEATEQTVQADLDRAGMTISPAERIDSVIRAMLVQANEDLARSEVANLRWNVAGVAKVPAYDTGGDTSMNADLNAITYANTDTGRFARDRAVQVGADQTVLFVKPPRDSAGLAWTPGHQSVCLWGSSHYVVAHEMGHNLDCNHDRETAGAADGGGYNYGHRYTVNGRDTGTIMSYASSRVPYFSNPDVTYNGAVLGVAAGQPKAADNARTIRENAAAMAGYRAAVNAPEITRQPESVAVSAGKSVSLSVAATGGNLDYQWLKDGATLPGATADTFRIAAVTSADAGSYTVVVSNPKGSVTSSAAIVTVAAGTPGGGTSSGGGSGGGGGAPSVWFMAGLGLLGAARSWRARMRR